MKIRDQEIEEVQREITGFLNNHEEITSSEQESLEKVPRLFNMLNQLYMRTDLSLEAHQQVSSAIRYINSDYDFMPADFSGPVGSIDDIMVAAVVLDKLSAEMQLEEYCEKTKELKSICSELISLGRQYLPSRVTQKIMRDFD